LGQLPFPSVVVWLWLGFETFDNCHFPLPLEHHLDLAFSWCEFVFLGVGLGPLVAVVLSRPLLKQVALGFQGLLELLLCGWVEQEQAEALRCILANGLQIGNGESLGLVALCNIWYT
jgi:hypothetical protein